jgi:ABC-type Fe3+/spermidine/putrescine transport system ATPase subunit
MLDGAVTLEHVNKLFGERTVVNDVNLEIHAGEFFSLLGPSGCGKTTTLRMIGGFELPDSGRILIDGRDVTHDEPETRPLNTVFQSYALFPHLNVFDNVAFGLRFEKPGSVSKKSDKERVMEALELVALGTFGERRVPQLSGGEQQRVALARALVLEPSVLLLDEPLGALDAQLRARLQVELASLQRQIGITFIYVTHDQHEAFTMSDRIAVFNKGEVVQLGTPHEIYERPRTEFVADFIGTTNLLAVRDGQRACIRPERITVTTTEPIAGSGKIHQGQVAEIAYLGATRNIIITVGDGHSITATVPAHDAIEPVALGQSVWCSWNPNEEFIITG